MPLLENHLKSHQLALFLPFPPLLSQGLLGNLFTAKLPPQSC